jgi:Tfp pilus assembly protein PilV
MAKQEQRETWQDIKEIWGNSSQGEKINFQFSTLIEELKANTSQWEKDAIKSDMTKLKSFWNQFKGNISQWEKDSIAKDVSKISQLLKKFLKKLKRKK